MAGAVVPGGQHLEQQRAVELGVDVAVDHAVLQRLEAADRLAELLAQLDVAERHVERASRNAEQLGGGAEHQQLLHRRTIAGGRFARARRSRRSRPQRAENVSVLDVEPSTFGVVAMPSPAASRGTRHSTVCAVRIRIDQE